ESVMRKLLAVIFLVFFSQFRVWASDRVVVELAPNVSASAVAAAVGGEVLDSIPGTSHFLMKVPSAAALARYVRLGVVSVELNDAVTVRPTGSVGILKTSASKTAEWYARQPAFKLVRADAALQLSKGTGIVIADLNAR